MLMYNLTDNCHPHCCPWPPSGQQLSTKFQT